MLPEPTGRTSPDDLGTWTNVIYLGPLTACTGFAYSIVTDRGHRDRRDGVPDESLRRAVGAR